MNLKIASLLKVVISAGVILFGSPSYAINVTFNDLNGQILGAAISSPGSGGTTAVQYDITNNTGSTWIDFHFGVGSPAGGNVIFGIDALGSNPYVGSGTATLSSQRNMVDVVGLNIPDGSVYISTLNLTFGEAPFALVSGTPSIVPVPAAVWLFLSSLLGLGLYARPKTVNAFPN